MYVTTHDLVGRDLMAILLLTLHSNDDSPLLSSPKTACLLDRIVLVQVGYFFQFRIVLSPCFQSCARSPQLKLHERRLTSCVLLPVLSRKLRQVSST